MSLKRVLFAALVPLLVLALLLPWLIGWDAERRYRQIVSEFEGPLNLSLESYERGWFSSRARVRLEPAGEGTGAVFSALGVNGPLTLEDRLAHGPLPLAAPPGYRWRPALAVINGRLHRDGRPGEAPVARVTYRVGVDGALDLDLASTAPEETGDAGASWRDMALHARIPAGPGETGMTLEADTLVFPAAGGRLSLEGLSCRVELVLPPSGLPTGTAQLNLDAVRATAAGNPRAIAWAEKLEVTVTLQQQGAELEGSVTGRLARLASPRRTYGPGSLSVEAKRFDAASLSRLTASLVRLSNQGMGGRALAMGTAGALLAEAPALLQHDPEISLSDTWLTTPDGRARAEGRLGLDDADPVVLNNPYLLQQAIGGRLELAVPPAAANHAALIHLRRHGLLETWGSPGDWLSAQVDRGRLLRQEGNFGILIELTDGRIEVNGRPLSEVRN